MSSIDTHGLDFAPFDCDNHYYEPVDAFTRFLDPAHGARCVEWVNIGKRMYPVVAGQLWRGVANPTFDPVSPAGAMHDYFRGNPDAKQPWEFLSERHPIAACYRDRDARLVEMDTQGLSRIWLFPTLGVLFEELLKADPGAVALTFTAFNRWLADDWGFSYQDRIFAAPYVSLADPDWACSEVEWAAERGARVIVMRPAAPTTEHGQITPFDLRFDRFWATIVDADLTVVIHAGDSGYSNNGYAADAFSGQFGAGGWQPTIKAFAIERAAADFVISSVFAKLFDRFPGLRMATVENGAGYLRDAMKKLTVTASRMPGYFAQDPVETLRSNWWVNPFWEDDIDEVVELMGANRVIFGSDWPHVEGMPKPLDFVANLDHLAPADRRKILHDNVASLTGITV